MIREEDLKEAIAECEGVRNPNANTCMKLAAFYTIQDKMYGDKNKQEMKQKYSFRSSNNYSYADEPAKDILEGKSEQELKEIFMEVLSTIKTIHPRLYDATMAKIAG